MSIALFAKPPLLKRLNKAMKALFANNEQGAWFDPSDLTTLFQDSAGTTPVTAVEQPVGLMLDKSKNLRYGANLRSAGVLTTIGTVTTGSYDTNSGDGTIYRGATVNDQSYVRFANLSANTFYETTLTITSGTIAIRPGNFSFLPLVTIGAGTYRLFVNTASNTEITITSSANSSTASFTGITIREIAGNHASQSTSANRPTLSARVNLFTKTQEFDDAAWTKGSVTIGANAIGDPLGGNTADKIKETSATAEHYVLVNGVTLPAAQHTFSAYFKAAERTWVNIYLSTGPVEKAYFDLQNGVVGTVTAGITAAISSAGNGWWRCSITKTTTAGTWYPVVNPALGDDQSVVYAGTTDSGIYIWGADLRPANAGVNLPVYQRVNTSTDYDTTGFPYYLKFNGSSSSMVTSTIDFVNSTIGARRNLLTYTQEFDNAVWLKVRSSITANAVTAPDGTTTAEKLVEDTTASNNHWAGNYGSQTVTTGVVYTFSAYVKAAERQYVTLNGDVSSGRFGTASVQFSLTDGTVVKNTNSLVTTATNVGNNWWRLSVTATALSTGTAYPALYIGSQVATGSNGVDVYTGDGTSGIYVWGAQLETGSSATAYQRVGTDTMTVVAGVRKASDAANGLLFEYSADSNSNNGTFNIFAPIVSGGFNTYLSGSKGTTSAAIGTGTSTFNAPITNVATLTASISTPLNTIRINGAQAATTSATQGTGNYLNYPLYIGARGGSSLYFNGNLYGLIVRGTASSARQISDAETYVNTKSKAY